MNLSKIRVNTQTRKHAANIGSFPFRKLDKRKSRDEH